MAEKQTAKRNRREEILQSLALMLESSDGSQRITTAKLAASVGVSEAALYRHFPSKTRMFDSLIEFIEDSLITRINLILKDEKDTTARLRLIVLLILGFGERNLADAYPHRARADVRTGPATGPHQPAF